MSMYDLPKLTWQVRQFGNPAIGERISTALAEPSAKLVEAEDDSLVRANAVSDAPVNPRPEVFAHRDYYRNTMDSASIYKRPDLDEGV